MHIHCLGLNHHTAEVCRREQLAFSEERAKEALARAAQAHLGHGPDKQPGALTEMVILSTCNRVEIYALSSETTPAPLERFWAETSGIDLEGFRPYLYHRLDQDAVGHLFRVAAGLDSLVLGEPQILGQVTAAFELARSQGAVGLVLARLFQAALHSGKRARAETAISQNPASIASVAIHLAGQAVPNLTEARVVVLGAGEMAELAVEALRKRGHPQVLVVNRTLERARDLAGRWGGAAATFEHLPAALREADILIASTGAPHTIIHSDLVAAARGEQPDRPLVVIDIAVPRDVDDAVGELPGVSLYSIDALRAHLAGSLAQRAREVPHVEQILAEEQAAFMDYLRALEVVPLIAELSQQAEAIRQAELDKTLRRMGDLTPAERQRLEALTQALVKKILHAPITCLRSEAGSPMAARYAAAARTLFGLDGRSGAGRSGAGHSQNGRAAAFSLRRRPGKESRR